MVKKIFSYLWLMLLLHLSNPVYGQFQTVTKQRKVASLQSESEIRQGNIAVDADGIHPTAEAPKPSKDAPLENINRQKTVAVPEENVKTEEVSGTVPPDTICAVRDKEERLLFSPPLDALEVTSHYGYRADPFSGKRKFHYGTDFRTSSQNVYAMLPGRIKKVGYNKVLGNYIELEHGEFDVVYAHLYTVRGNKGDSVDAGQCVGISGSTGRSTGDHLHVSMRYRNKSVNPYPLIRYICDFTTGKLSTQLDPAP